MPGGSTVEAIFLLRQFIEMFREKRRNLDMVFVDSKKA